MGKKRKKELANKKGGRKREASLSPNRPVPVGKRIRKGKRGGGTLSL